jgi:hypothetical protein
MTFVLVHGIPLLIFLVLLYLRSHPAHHLFSLQLVIALHSISMTLRHTDSSSALDSHSLNSLVNPFAGQNIGYLRLAVVGDSGVGKTSFARQFTETLPEVLSHDWEPVKVEEDYARTPSLIEKFSSTMMEIPWDNMDADDEVPARNLVFVGEYLTPRHTLVE